MLAHIICEQKTHGTVRNCEMINVSKRRILTDGLKTEVFVHVSG